MVHNTLPGILECTGLQSYLNQYLEAKLGRDTLIFYKKGLIVCKNKMDMTKEYNYF